jgi:hypothetical protein
MFVRKYDVTSRDFADFAVNKLFTNGMKLQLEIKVLLSRDTREERSPQVLNKSKQIYLRISNIFGNKCKMFL